MSGKVIDDGAIPPGEYRLKYLGYRTTVSWGVPRVVVRFSVLDYGEYFEHELERWYRVNRLRGKPGKNGNYDVGRRSRLFRHFARLFGEPIRGDRLSFAGLKGKIVIGEVRTVTHDSDQKPLSVGAQYSTIEELLRIE